MRLRVLSDLHFEFHRDGGRGFVASLDVRRGDVAVLAGDVATCWGLDQALTALCDLFDHVVYVAGNHEYYGARPSDVDQVRERLAARLRQLHWLDCSAVTIEGQRFLGATLWFDEDAGARPERLYLNDFHAIEDFEPWVYRQHDRAVAFLRKEVSAGDVVVTHHLPSQGSVAAEYKTSPLNPFFVSDLEPLIAARQPRVWVHGHTHAPCDYRIGATLVVCNPFGYLGHEEAAGFDAGLVVEINAQSR